MVTPRNNNIVQYLGIGLGNPIAQHLHNTNMTQKGRPVRMNARSLKLSNQDNG